MGLACVWRLLEARTTATSSASLPVEHVIRLLAAANLGHRLVRAMHGLHKAAQAQVRAALSVMVKHTSVILLVSRCTCWV